MNRKDLLRQRADHLQWLADVFALMGPFCDLPEGHTQTEGRLGTQWQALKTSIENRLEGRTRDLVETQIATEGTSYFEVQQGGVPLPLYGSWWLEGKLQGDTTHRVMEILRNEDLGTTVETADYLPTELEFISLLFQMEAEGHAREDADLAQKGQDLRQEVLNDLVVPWVRRFKEKADSVIGSDYWKHAIGLIEPLLLDDV